MKIKGITDQIFMLDLEPFGKKNLLSCYIFKGKAVAIIDPGPSSTIRNLLRGLRELGIKQTKVRYAILSHIHLDHGGGAGELAKHFPKIKIVLHAKGAKHLTNPKKLWTQSKEVLGRIAELYGEPKPVAKKRINVLGDGEKLHLDENISLEAIETLGHSSHHLCFHEKLTNGVFVGDAAGIYLKEFDAIIPTTPTPFRFDMAVLSLKKLKNLEPTRLYFSHFGDTVNGIEKIQMHMNQLEIWIEEIKQNAKNQNLDEIIEKLREIDKNMQKISQFKGNKILYETIIESINGIKKFVQNYCTLPEPQFNTFEDGRKNLKNKLRKKLLVKKDG